MPEPKIPVAFDTLPALDDWEQQQVGQAIERRRHDTIQQCVFCADRARWAYVAHEMNPPRWMDVCHKHGEYLRGRGSL